MEEKEWITSELERVYHNSRDYKQKALLAETIRLLQEQYLRIEQKEGELDGSLWSPKDW
ncbi:hypothetical protein [Pisciglobus halotolerans]|uniref:Uncharacterized protein n=1 Tax=Pisciglobus halotolerans TaxID=745365 RepID=A0A1I3DRP3_9LACT|nr:hypothetical protein [Pisciglobus halotolerans]SFH89151.1 hypothetical protein SAMN04489868_1495 [Pisciglobus halotolerans]